MFKLNEISFKCNYTVRHKNAPSNFYNIWSASMHSLVILCMLIPEIIFNLYFSFHGSSGHMAKRPCPSAKAAPSWLVLSNILACCTLHVSFWSPVVLSALVKIELEMCLLVIADVFLWSECRFSWYVTTGLYYGDTIVSLSHQTRKTWYSEYSKWLPPVAFWQI